ncbi:hypothetical protein FRACA_390021 [Frankia canadensis]|uniref:Uncharacterized protein n=1 Tax=Frankia canadensis TaxID=1836972 RepID=A0A2I2KW53_9ACTN|nr:hypothetical protein [Frankia canadensis]SNQ49907.1 hypothetical protein FRACA_390021 [Frankia canadensis]SOU57197.1 hypothetical protein FRACA_390021 [Frankia canadensis]
MRDQAPEGPPERGKAGTDEGTGEFQGLVLARLHRSAFEHLGVRACPKLTGRRGVQIWMPVAPGTTFDETRAWDELDDPALRPDSVTIRTVFDRLARRGDPFRAVLDASQPLPPLT